MPAKVVETHCMKGESTDCKVEIEGDGTVWIHVGEEILSVDKLTEMVEFVEYHGKVTVKG